jgi:hypothetical protein
LHLAEAVVATRALVPLRLAQLREARVQTNKFMTKVQLMEYLQITMEVLKEDLFIKVMVEEGLALQVEQLQTLEVEVGQGKELLIKQRVEQEKL